MCLVFLRHAYSRFLGVKDAIKANLPTRGGKTRRLTKDDFSHKSAIFRQPRVQFDTLAALPDSADRAKAIIDAMESIEADYENLRGVLPESEYQELDNAPCLAICCAPSVPRKSSASSAASTNISLPSSPTRRPTTAASSSPRCRWSR